MPIPVAINNLYDWYHRAAVCYVHLSDVPSGEDPEAGDSTFRRSRWFQRAWTLPELLAPKNVPFFSTSWDVIGVKAPLLHRTDAGQLVEETLHDLSRLISEITGIKQRYLKDPCTISEASAAERISWAAGRRATREEDRAYSLMGLFGIRMPIEYGEAIKPPFIKLQEEILKKSSDDRSILAWGIDAPSKPSTCSSPSCPSYLAPSPDAFHGPDWAKYLPGRDDDRYFMSCTERGVSMLIIRFGESGSLLHTYPFVLGLLGCNIAGKDSHYPNAIALLLRIGNVLPGHAPVAYRVRGYAPFLLNPSLREPCGGRRTYLQKPCFCQQFQFPSIQAWNSPTSSTIPRSTHTARPRGSTSFSTPCHLLTPAGMRLQILTSLRCYFDSRDLTMSYS